VFTDTAVPTNTFIWLPLPATNTPKPGGGEPANTATNTPVPSADLWITNDDGQSMYAPGDTLNYVVTVTNDGPAAVDGAIVTNTFTGGVISTIDWNCAGAACPTAAGSGDINEVLNNLPSSDTVTYTIAVVLFNTTGGNVASAASVSLPGGYTDPGPLPNSANDSDAPLVGTTGPDCSGPMDPDCLYDLPAPNSLTIYVSIVADGDVGTWDLVYYERPHTAPAGIYLDVVRIEISDGTNTYTVFEWGDGNPNPNTNIASVPVPPEDDNTFIGAGSLYNGSGVAIDIDHPALGIPSGTTYTQIIITALDGGPPDDGNCGIDGIEVLP
ncbi:MAG: hypothetical protein JW730_02555, partial [Anaerolineales bacterium]|nr:hypothetical protein [Anaerolineales bacterium]